MKADLAASKQVFKTIDEIAEKIIDYRGKTPPKAKKGIKLITAKVIKDGSIVEGNHEYISQDTYDQWMTRGFPQKGDVLFTTEAPLGEVAILKSSERIALAQRVVLLRGKPALVDQTYLMYALKSSFVQRQLRERSASTTVEGIKQSELRQVRIPLLPLEEQKRIAEIARKCDLIRRTRRYIQQLSDTYLQSVFMEMFGDPKENPKNWDCDLFEIAIISTQNGCGQRRDFSDRGTIVLRIRDLQEGWIDYSEPRRMRLLPEDTKKYHLKENDLLLVRVNGNPNLVGRAASFAEIGEPVVFSDHIIRAKFRSDLLNSKFAAFLLNTNFGRNEILSKISTTAGQFTINSLGLSRIKMIYPPLHLQERFIEISKQYNRLYSQQRETSRQAEHLYQTVLHRAFQGEL